MNALVQNSNRVFVVTERRLSPVIQTLQPPQGRGGGWGYFVEAQSIHHALFPTTVPQRIEPEERKAWVNNYLVWWLGVRASQPASPIGQAIVSQFPSWQPKDLYKLREFLAFALIVCVRFMEGVLSRGSSAPAQFYAFPAPGTEWTADYLLKLYEERQRHPDWHALRIPLSVIAPCKATIEHRYPEGVEVRFRHPQGGWVRALVPPTDLPGEAEEGDMVNVSFEQYDEAGAEIGSVEVVAESWKGAARQPVSEFTHLIPELPPDLSDAAAMAKYRTAMRRAVGEG